MILLIVMADARCSSMCLIPSYPVSLSPQFQSCFPLTLPMSRAKGEYSDTCLLFLYRALGPDLPNARSVDVGNRIRGTYQSEARPGLRDKPRLW